MISPPLEAGGEAHPGSLPYLSQSVSKVVSKSQFPHKFANLLFMSVIVSDKLTDLWGSKLLQNDFKTTL